MNRSKELNVHNHIFDFEEEMKMFSDSLSIIESKMQDTPDEEQAYENKQRIDEILQLHKSIISSKSFTEYALFLALKPATEVFQKNEIVSDLTKSHILEDGFTDLKDKLMKAMVGVKRDNDIQDMTQDIKQQVINDNKDYMMKLEERIDDTMSKNECFKAENLKLATEILRLTEDFKTEKHKLNDLWETERSQRELYEQELEIKNDRDIRRNDQATKLFKNIYKKHFKIKIPKMNAFSLEID